MTINDILTKIKSKEPQLFDKNGDLILEKFKSYLNNEKIPLSKESYTLNWLGKSYAKALVNDHNRTLLAPNTTHNTKEKNAQSNNLLIQGDNLAVLKHLRKAYRNSVKMIYIDPPYNTGSDGFVYNDDRKYSAKQIAKITGENEEIAQRIFDFINRHASSHSAWLTFMYPRLKVARELLKDDGVIFISIDDNEQAQLKMLCDEVFGEENIEMMIWNKEAEGASGTLKVTQRFRKIHEYIFIIYKNKDMVCFTKINEALKGKENVLQTANLAVNSSKEDRNHQNYFTIINPNGKSFTRQWKWSEKEILKLKKDDLLYWGSDGNKQPRLIIPTDDRRKTFLLSILNYGGTTVGRKDFEQLFAKKIEFSYPKPIILLTKLLRTATKNNDLILDFFAGSGTTAHAVMQLNAEDGGNRNYICVQLDEPTDKKSEAHKAGYNTIFEITKERIKRAAAKIKEENPDYKGDLGFKEFRLSPYPKGYGIAPQTPQEGVAQGELFAKLDLDSEKLNTLLTTWTVNDGLPLTEQTQAIDLNGYTAYVADKRLYLLYERFNNTHLADLLAKLDDMQNSLNIEKIIAFGHHFDSKTQREIEEAVNQYKTRKGVQLYWETRYE